MTRKQSDFRDMLKYSGASYCGVKPKGNKSTVLYYNHGPADYKDKSYNPNPNKRSKFTLH